MDRFSEDLDFSLQIPETDFSLSEYFSALEKEVRSFGLNVVIEEKEKTKDSNIRSAFLKGNTKEHLMLFYTDDQISGNISKNEIIKIKLEVDVNPPAYAGFETKCMTFRHYLRGKSTQFCVGHGKTESKEETYTIMFFICPEELASI